MKDFEYYVVLLINSSAFQHEGELYATDHLHEAINFMNRYFSKHQVDVAVWQPRTEGYRDYKRTEPDPEPTAQGTKRCVVFWTSLGNNTVQSNAVTARFKDFDDKNVAEAFYWRLKAHNRNNELYQQRFVSNVAIIGN